MDTIAITGLRIPTVIGVYQWEQRIKQTLIIDVELSANVLQAAENEELEATVNYAQASAKIKNLLINNSFRLIETVAEKIAQMLLIDFQLSEVTVQVAKPSVASDLTQVSVKITRHASA